MTRTLGWIDVRLIALGLGGALANAVAVAGNGVDWYERPAWLAAAGFGALVEWLIAFSWWEKHQHRPRGWLYVVVNQLVVLLLFAGGIGVGMGWQQLRSGTL